MGVSLKDGVFTAFLGLAGSGALAAWPDQKIFGYVLLILAVLLLLWGIRIKDEHVWAGWLRWLSRNVWWRFGKFLPVSTIQVVTHRSPSAAPPPPVVREPTEDINRAVDARIKARENRKAVLGKLQNEHQKATEWHKKHFGPFGANGDPPRIWIGNLENGLAREGIMPASEQAAMRADIRKNLEGKIEYAALRDDEEQERFRTHDNKLFWHIRDRYLQRLGARIQTELTAL